MTRPKGTTQDIAEQEGLSVKRIYQVAVEAGFPPPLYVVGKTKFYDLRKVRRYFEKRGDKRRTVNV